MSSEESARPRARNIEVASLVLAEWQSSFTSQLVHSAQEEASFTLLLQQQPEIEPEATDQESEGLSSLELICRKPKSILNRLTEQLGMVRLLTLTLILWVVGSLVTDVM